MSTVAPSALQPPAAAAAAGGGLLGSFALASLLIVAGVLAAWVAVKRDASESAAVSLSLDDLPAAVRDGPRGGVRMLLEQADVAFAAGRIVEPEYDNALYFYLAVLSELPADTAAQTGVQRVVDWLSGEATVALDARDWPRALAAAEQIVALRPGDAEARQRLARMARIRDLGTAAQRLLASGSEADLLAAGQRFRDLLALDPDNLAALDGLRRARAELLRLGNDAVSDDRLAEAGRLLAAARSIEAGEPEATALAERIEAASERVSGAQRTAELEAARAALEAGSLLAADGSDAFSLFEAMLDANPDDAQAADGLVQARAALLRSGREALAALDYDRVDQILERAREVGASAAAREELAEELGWRRYLREFELGMHQEPRPISAFTVLRQRAATYPRTAATRDETGWVDVEFTIAADGSVREALARDASSQVFVGASLDAIRDWRFEPVLLDGRPVPARGVVRFSFRF